MIRIGTAGLPRGVKNSLEAVKWLHDNGLNAMEVEFVHGVNMSMETAKKLSDLASHLDIKLSVHAPYYINLCNPEKREASMKRIIDSAKRAKMFGGITVFHPGFYGKFSKEECANFVAEACKEMSDYLLGPETTGKLSQFGTLDELLEISRKVENCVPVIDFAHIFARNQGKIDYEEILDKMKKFGHIHAHFSGINFGPKGEINHEPIGRPDFVPLAKLLKKKRIDITIICESPLLEEDALKMKRILDSL